MPTAAIYCRVSSTMQEDGASLDEQERLCREYAARQNLSVVAAFHETEDGEEIDRLKLRQLLVLGKRGEAQFVIVWKQDRLGRGNKAHEVVFYMCELSGLEPLCVLEPYGESSEAMMTRGMRGIVSGEEKKNIRLRTQLGRKARARSGKIIPGPRPLYGYRWIDSGSGKGQTKTGYAPHSETAAIVRRIFAEAASGRSLRKIADGLNDDGVPTPKGGALWRNSTLRILVRHPAYCGRWQAYGSPLTERVRSKDGKRYIVPVGERPEEQKIPLPAGTVPALVSIETWAIAQEKVARNRIIATRRNRSPETFLLRAGFVRCGHCGRPAYASWSRYKQQPDVSRYCINRRGKQVAHYDCPSASIHSARLDAIVWQKLEALILEEETIRREVAKLHTDDPTVAELRLVERDLADVIRQQEQAARTIILLDNEAGEPVRRQLTSLARRKADLEQERVHIAVRRAAWARTQDVLDQIEAWRARVACNFANLTYELKRDLLVALDVRVTLWPAKHEPRYTIEAAVPLLTQDESVSHPAYAIATRSTR